LLVDTVCTTLIGFDYKKIPSLINGLKYNILDLNEIKLKESKVILNQKEIKFFDLKPIEKLVPTKSWENHIEL